MLLLEILYNAKIIPLQLKLNVRSKEFKLVSDDHTLCSSRKYPYSPHRKDWKFQGGGGSQSHQNLNQCMKLNWNFQRGGGAGHSAGMF